MSTVGVELWLASPRIRIVKAIMLNVTSVLAPSSADSKRGGEGGPSFAKSEAEGETHPFC
jgi:hypothetical protein